MDACNEGGCCGDSGDCGNKCKCKNASHSEVKTYDLEEMNIVAALHNIQQRHKYLPKEEVIKLADRLNIPLSQVYRMATFYKAFSLKPQGDYKIKLCTGTACHVRGAAKILQNLEEILGIKPGETTKDQKFSLETVNCLGACAIGPLVVVETDYFGQMNPSKAEKLIKSLYKEK